MMRPLLGSFAPALLMLLSACSSGRTHGAAQTSAADASSDASGAAERRIDARVDALVTQMTLDEKLTMMAGSKADRGLWLTPGVERLGVPGYAMSDGARGLGATQSVPDSPQKATAFPTGSARGATFDESLEERIGEAIGQEARAWGADVILAPVVNVLRHPRWGRSQETYGEDPVHLGRMGAAFVRGAQHHVIANAKHYAVNDIEDTRFSVNVTVDERTLREVFLAPFAATVEAGVGSVMSAYNQVNGSYCSESTHLLHDILKGEWGFRGFVESDWILAVRSTAPSVNAGLDLEMPVASYFALDKLHAALRSGEISEASVDEAVKRLVRGHLELEARIDPTPPPIDVVGSAEHGALALDAEREAITLLTNHGGALPIDRSKIGTLAVVGTYAGMARLGDNGSSKVVPGHAVTPLDGLRDRGAGVTIQVVDADVLSPLDQATVAAAGAAIVVVGLSPTDEGEFYNGGGDRKTLALSTTHQALIQSVSALNPRTIVVVESGSAVTMDAWQGGVAAILMAWYPGQEGGDAIADVVFGDVNPSGHLPVTVPVNEAQLPPFDSTSTEVNYGYFHGYRYVDHAGETPAFPFGFGLSYTTFEYGNLVLSDAALDPTGALTVSVDVKNTGARAGDAVPQLYVGYTGSSVDRPVRELKGFSRVHLAPGETKTVSLRLAARDLAYYDVSAGAWTLEHIPYTAYVGASSRDLPLHADFHVP